MEKILVKADKRPEIGKGGARSLRRTGLLPAIVYSEGKSMSVKINSKQMTRLITSGVGEHALITLELHEDGKTSERPVLVKDYQRDPVSEELLHVDFLQVSLKKAVNVHVRIELLKKPVGVKMGGILEYRLREVEVECLPTEIPANIEIDAEFIQIGQSLHVSDLPELEGVKMLTPLEEVILTVTAPVVEEEPVEEVEEAEEPELVKGKGKEEEPAAEEKKEEK